MSESRLQWACDRENTLLRHMEVALAQERAHSAELLAALQAEKTQRRLRESDLLKLQLKTAAPKSPTLRQASPPRSLAAPEQKALKMVSPVRKVPPAAHTSECIGCRDEIPRLRGRIAELSKKLSEAKMKQPPPPIPTTPNVQELCDASRVAAFLRELLIAAMDEDPHRCRDAMQRRCVPALSAMLPPSQHDDTAARHMGQLCDVIVRLRQRANRDADYPADVSAVHSATLDASSTYPSVGRQTDLSSYYQTIEPESFPDGPQSQKKKASPDYLSSLDAVPLQPHYIPSPMYPSVGRATDPTSYVQTMEPDSFLVAPLQPHAILSPARSEDVMSMSRLLNASSCDPASTRTAGGVRDEEYGGRSPRRQNEMTYDEWKTQFLAAIEDGCDE